MQIIMVTFAAIFLYSSIGGYGLQEMKPSVYLEGLFFLHHRHVIVLSLKGLFSNES